ncbi:mesoderm-specific transcript homolog -like [Paramuricea clavata]|uniref:Mesoderm-specific transcript homolog -like n=1 Tax=Paramuricea clavata TaxID=317549 RepID=A0A6S7GEZ0_PARCT|nr:mesoderm-specific transcript homolog -like [Paramuricea clavata]
MGFLYNVSKRLVLVGIAVLIGVYLNFPAPNMSDSLRLWVQSGQFFLHGVAGKGVKIFHKDVNGYGHKSKVLLLIHGFPTSSYDWNKVWEPLREKFGRVVTADMAGFGFSDKPKETNYTIKLQADMFEDLLTSLNVKEVNILAHDLGLTVALELLARYEERKKNKLTHEGVNIISLCLTNGGKDLLTIKLLLTVNNHCAGIAELQIRFLPEDYSCIFCQRSWLGLKVYRKLRSKIPYTKTHLLLITIKNS